MLIPTILCGGAGSRLWPISRELYPKPFIRLGDGQSLLQKSFLRGAAQPGVAELLTVTNRELFFKTQDDFREVAPKGLAQAFLLEPFGRNTAAAIAAAVLYAEERHGAEAVLLVLAADHLIAHQPAFDRAVARAQALAEEGRLVTFGIRPTAPETGYGYIEAEGERVLRFVEKPDAARAQAFLEGGRHLWNSGMFCFRAGVMREELRRHCPEVLEAVERCLAASPRLSGAADRLELLPELFEAVPDISIDYAVMEKSDRVSVVPCDIGWSDIGSWDALTAELAAPDADGNRVVGEAVLLDVKNSFFQSEHKIVGAIGLEDVIVVDTPDALLVTSRARAQDVKQLYAELKRRRHTAFRLHNTVARPWGTYTVLEEGSRYKIKRIMVKPGASLSLQAHHHRSEHWIVVSGAARVVNGDQEMMIGPNQSTYISAGCRHRLSNPGVIDLVMIEVQSGEYLGEDDIVRFDDIYGRTPAC